MDAGRIIGALRKFLRGLGYPKAGLTVLFGSDAHLRTLNARHRGRAKPTDVLSWSYLEGTRRQTPPVLGELALSVDRIRVQAKANGWSMETEALRLLAHGCVHLVGYDHETPAEDAVMRALEEKLLARVGVRGLYPPPAASPAKTGRRQAHKPGTAQRSRLTRPKRGAQPR